MKPKVLYDNNANKVTVTVPELPNYTAVADVSNMEKLVAVIFGEAQMTVQLYADNRKIKEVCLGKSMAQVIADSMQETL